MDLRPLNPYYHKPAAAVSRIMMFSARAAVEEYSYPYLWIEPVVDRKEEDIQHIRELQHLGMAGMNSEQLAEYIAGMKGALNKADLERVENNIQIMLDVLEIEASSNIGNVPAMPTEEYFEVLLSNVEAIRGAYCIHQTTPVTPSMPLNTWQKWNEVEQILYDVHEILCNNFHYYCGEGLYLNEETALLL